MVDEARRTKGEGVVGQNPATSNANVVVRHVARLGVADTHAYE
jgi:hypothetical protein